VSKSFEEVFSENLDIKQGERSMRKILLSVTFSAFVLFILSAEVTYAQPRRARGRVYTKAEVDRLIKRVEERTDDFVKEFDKSLDRSRLNGTRREDELNRRAHDLESATDELRREFDRRDTWQENRDEVRKCLRIASDIDVAMRNRKLGGRTESTWVEVRAELNTLAQLYNVPLVGSAAYR
jgi:hypothetical protein